MTTNQPESKKFNQEGKQTSSEASLAEKADFAESKSLGDERDINDIFEDIVLTENRLHNEGYREGFEKGCSRGNQEGYQLGFAQGLHLGQELGNIYGTTVAELQLDHTEKLKRALSQLRKAIEEFPRGNDADKDILGAVEQIRNLNKRVQVMLGGKKQYDTLREHKDYTF